MWSQIDGSHFNPKAPDAFREENGRDIFSKETAELIIGCCPARTLHFQGNPVTQARDGKAWKCIS